MRAKRMAWLGSAVLVVGVGGPWAAVNLQEPIKKALAPKLDVPYVPTPEPVVAKMMEMAQVKPGDVVYDLGCGDGRIVITAAKEHGATGVGVDIDPQRIRESNANARKAGVEDRVKFTKGDLFQMDLKDATVVMLYLLPELNLKLRPKLFEQLKPGTRIVSHEFDMGEWKPEKTVTLKLEQGTYKLHSWTIPAKEDQPKFRDGPSG